MNLRCFRPPSSTQKSRDQRLFLVYLKYTLFTFKRKNLVLPNLLLTCMSPCFIRSQSAGASFLRTAFVRLSGEWFGESNCNMKWKFHFITFLRITHARTVDSHVLDDRFSAFLFCARSKTVEIAISKIARVSLRKNLQIIDIHFMCFITPNDCPLQ